jgi:hypothetical protein
MQEHPSSRKRDDNPDAEQRLQDAEMAMKAQLMRGYEDVLAGRVSPAAEAMAAIRVRHGWNDSRNQ